MDKWLNNPNILKVVSVLLALLLWATVHFDPQTPGASTTTLDTKEYGAVKIQVIGLDENKHDLRLLEPSVVRMMARGTFADLLSASEDDYQVYVDLTGIGDGQHILPIKVKAPKRVDIIELSPARVTVLLEPLETKAYNVQVKTTGTPANDYKAGTPVVKPSGTVQVTLPTDHMSQVGSVVAAVSIDKQENTVTAKKVRLAVYDKSGEEMTDAVVSPETVEVEVPITKPSKTLPLRVSYTGSLPSGLSLVSVKPDVQEVTVYGPQTELDKFNYFDNVVINLSTIKESGALTVELKPMDGLAAVSPDKVTLNIEVTPHETRTLPQVPITVTGLSEGLDSRFVTPEGGRMDVQVRGAPSNLAELGAGDFQLTADLSGLAPGRHTVALEVSLPAYVELEEARLTAVVEIIESRGATVTPDEGGEEPSAQESGSKSSGSSSSSGSSGTSANTGSSGSGAGNGGGSSTNNGSGNNSSGSNSSGNSSSGSNGGNSSENTGSNNGGSGNSGTGNMNGEDAEDGGSSNAAGNSTGADDNAANASNVRG